MTVKPIRILPWLAALVAAALIATGCGAARNTAPPEPQTPTPPPAEQVQPTPGPPAGQPVDQPVPIVGVQFTDNLSQKAVPIALLDWVATQKEQTAPAFKVLTEGDATYIAVTGGKQPSRGYRLELVSYQLPEAGGKPVVTLNVKIQAPQGDPINSPNPPVRYFRITPQLVGQVKVNFISGS